MNKMEQSVKQSAKKMINHMLEREYLGWPPFCVGYYYQPKKPAVPEQLKNAKK